MNKTDDKFKTQDYLNAASKENKVSGTAGDVPKIPLDKIRPNPNQPRKTFVKVTLEQLARSIKERGVEQPVIVRRVNDLTSEFLYELAAGERRVRAARMAGLTEIPAIIKDIPDNDMRTIALVENIQRDEMTFMDTARGYMDLRDEFGSSDVIAERVGKDKSTIAKYLRYYSDIYAVPEIAALFEKEAAEISLRKAEAYSKISGKIIHLRKSNKTLFSRMLKKIIKDGGIEKSLPFLIKKFTKDPATPTGKTSTNGMFKETETELMLDIRIKKNIPVSKEIEENIQKSLSAFMEKLSVLKEVKQ